MWGRFWLISPGEYHQMHVSLMWCRLQRSLSTADAEVQICQGHCNCSTSDTQNRFSECHTPCVFNSQLMKCDFPFAGTIDFFVNARDPLDLPGPSFVIPKLSVSMKAKITVVSSTTLNIQLTGTHDKFPNFEMYVSDKSVYDFDVLKQGSGLGVLDLAASSVSVNEFRIISLP